jgi:hypothetical protein
LAANASAGATSLTLASSARFLPGDSIQVMLDTNIYFNCVVNTVPSHTTITIVPPGLSYSASSGNIVEDLTADAVANIG